MLMIFVTVSGWAFDRLIKAVDELVGSGKIKENAVMQIGNTKYEPKNCEWFRFESTQKITDLNRTARIIISHAGAGCVIAALKFKKPLIIVPRYKRFGEHVNDHQRDLAEVLEREKIAIAVYDIAGLESAIRKAKKPKARGEKAHLVSGLKKYLDNEPL